MIKILKFIHTIWVMPMLWLSKQSWKYGYLMLPHVNSQYTWRWWKRIAFVKLSKSEIDSIYQFYKMYPDGRTS